MSERFPRINLAEVQDIGRELISHRLFYRGLNNKIVGKTGSGKTILLTRLILENLREGGTPAHLDMEIGEAGSKAIYVAHGATPDELAGIHYVPMPAPRLEEADEFVRTILDEGENFAVFDKKPDFLRSMRLAENSNDDQSDFYGSLIDPLRDKVTTVILAPTGHTGEHEQGARGRGGSESDYKYDAIWQLTVAEAFDRDRVGRLTLKCTKDRWGYIGFGRIVEFRIGGDAKGHIEFQEVASGFETTEQKAANDLEGYLLDRAVDAGRAVAPDASKAQPIGKLTDWLDASLPAQRRGSAEQRITAIKRAAKLDHSLDGLAEVATGKKHGRHDVYHYHFREAER